jgi:octaprenyl-diphosphate synthase
MHEVKTTTELTAARSDDLYSPILPDLRRVESELDLALRGCDELADVLLVYVSRFRGKMLRPAILLLSGQVFGNITQKHIQFSVMVELLHLATLIHDDVLDQADLRRNHPTVNRLWGNEASVLLGDYLLSKAFDLGNRCGEQKIMCMISESAKRVCEGELLQSLSRKDWSMTEARYIEIIGMKTGILYELCCSIGSILAGADEDSRRALEHFGRYLGLAFQITDDLLDLTGTEEKVGKTLGRDLQQAKPTLPLIHFLNQSNSSDRDHVLSMLENGEVDNSAILTYLNENGSLDYSYKKAEEYISRALSELNHLPSSSAKGALVRIAEQITKRTC